MITISFHIRKGGTGKSTSTINVAAVLAKMGYRVLVGDVDAQTNTTTFFRQRKELIHNDQTRENLTMDDILNDVDIELDIHDAIYETAYENLSIIPGTKKLERTERSLQSVISIDTRTILLEHLPNINEEFDFLLLDTAPIGEGIVNCNALCASDRVYIPLYVSAFEFEGLTDVQKVVKNLRRANPKLKVGGAFICKFEKRFNNCKDAEEYMRTNFPDLYMATNIKKAEIINDASYDGIPLIYRDPKAREDVTKQYIELTEEIIRRG